MTCITPPCRSALWRSSCARCSTVSSAGRCRTGAGVGAGEGYPLVTNVFCIVVFVLAIVLGLSLGGSFKTYGKLLRDSGFGADYGAGYGVGTGILNFGIYGLFIVLYYNLIGANWNAATIGCVFCMVCCCFKGSHPGNVWPIMVGYVAASFATKGLCAALGTDFTTAINAQAIVIGLCFANRFPRSRANTAGGPGSCSACCITRWSQACRSRTAASCSITAASPRR